MAHHREGHVKGGSGGGGDSGTGESFNSGVVAGKMSLFQAIDDASVSSKSKPILKNSELVVKKSRNTVTQTFLKFDVVGIVETVVSAKIILRSTVNSGFGGELRVAGDNWSESTITWANRPDVDFGDLSVISAVGAVASDTYYEWDVLSVVGGDQGGNRIYSFAITCDSCASKYQSGEAAMAPYLVVVEEDVSSEEPDEPIELVFAGAGDIADCGTGDPMNSGAAKTAQLLGEILMQDEILVGGADVSFFTTGDGAYNEGSLQQYIDCYDPTWGLYFEWTNPTPGNHEYLTPDAAGYFAYFGARAGDPSEGYYSYDIGSWHFIALNSNCGEISGCDLGSPQNKWLRLDLAAYSDSCVVAYLHHPPYSSGEHGGDGNMRPLMEALYENGVEILIAGHDHSYERFAPQDADGVPDLAKGVRLFVVGSGGTSLRTFRTPIANSEARFNSRNGILKLMLHPSSYDWEFIPVAASNPEAVEKFLDVGSAWCHGDIDE
jgi:hypothetical protein